jgi:hypothetical protein
VKITCKNRESYQSVNPINPSSDSNKIKEGFDWGSYPQNEAKKVKLNRNKLYLKKYVMQ